MSLREDVEEIIERLDRNIKDKRRSEDKPDYRKRWDEVAANAFERVKGDLERALNKNAT